MTSGSSTEARLRRLNTVAAALLLALALVAERVFVRTWTWIIDAYVFAGVVVYIAAVWLWKRRTGG